MDLNLDAAGIHPNREVHWHLPESKLYEVAVLRGEGQITQSGALAVLTGEHTGRAPKDRFIVRQDSTDSTIDLGDINLSMSPEHFDLLHSDISAYLSDQGAVCSRSPSLCR